jgi:predicted Na+-dependent transporter
MEGIHPAQIVGFANHAMMFCAMFALGLSQPLGGLVALWRQPSLLARSLLAIWVLVPLVAWLVVQVPGVTEPVHHAILFMAAAASAPFVIRKAAGKVPTASAYAVDLQIAVAALAIVTVPITVALLGLGRVPPLEVAGQVLQVQLVALLLGVLIRHLRPALGERLVRPFAALALLLLVLISLVVGVAVGPKLLAHLNGPGMLAVAVVVICSMAIGHVLGGPRPDTRIALALIAATRNLGLALLLAHIILPEGDQRLATQAMILTYTLVTQVLHVPYLMWRKRVAARHAGGAHPAPA